MKTTANTDLDVSGQVCYALVKLDVLHKEIKADAVPLNEVEKKLWEAEKYIAGLRERIENI